MPRRRRRVLASLIVVGLAGVAYVLWTRPAGPANVDGKAIGTLELQADTLTSLWGDALPVEAGRLVVPENRERRDSHHIEIAFLRLRSTSTAPLPAIFMLAGGPGTSGTSLGRTEYFYAFERMRALADVVLVDQRGTGLSIPSLACEGQLGLPTDITRDIEPLLVSTVAGRVAGCVDRLRRRGIDVTAYHTGENAADLEDLRRALGYDRVTLFGYSYGTELATAFMGRYPAAIHSAILAGPVAPDQALKLPADVQAQFDAIGGLAKQDARLRHLVPDVVGLMHAVHEALRARPQFIQVPLMDAVDEGDAVGGIFRVISWFKPYWEMQLGEFHLQMMVQDMIGADAWLGRLPAFYYRIANGDTRQVGNLLRNFRRRPLPNALFFTTACATGYSPDRYSVALAEEESTVLSVNGLSFGRLPRVCQAAGLAPRPGGSDAPPGSDRPVLMIAGTLDGRTPLRNVEALRRRYPDATLVSIVNAGHNRLLDGTTFGAVERFLRGEPVEPRTVERTVDFEAPVPFAHSLSDTLHGTILSNGVTAALAQYRDLRDSHGSRDAYDYDFSEPELNRLGYRLLGESRPEDAAVILGLNAEMYPASSNVYDSLGEACARLGRREDALANYRRAIEIDFMNGHAQGMYRRLLAESGRAAESR